MADVQMDPHHQPQPLAVRVPPAVWMLIGLLALVMAVTTALAVATLLDDSTPAPQHVRVPVPVAVDVAAAKAMKDESAAANAVGEAYSPPTFNPGGAKVEAANKALSMRSLGLKQMLETTDLAKRLKAADAASGTNAKHEAATAAAIGNP